MENTKVKLIKNSEVAQVRAIRNNRSLSCDVLNAKIVEDYKNDIKVHVIRKTYSTSYATIYRALHEAGIERRFHREDKNTEYSKPRVAVTA